MNDQLALRDARLATGSLGGSFGEQGHLPPRQRPFYLLVPKRFLDPHIVATAPLLFFSQTDYKSAVCTPHDVSDKGWTGDPLTNPNNCNCLE